MNILIATDAWHPQVNGVARTLSMTIRSLEEMGHQVRTVNPSQYKTVTAPLTSDVRLPIWVRSSSLKPHLDWADCVHVSTEGPIGLAVRRLCLRSGSRFTTAYHTDIPGFVHKALGFGSSLAKAYLRWFHAQSSCVMATTQRNAEELKSDGHRQPIKLWSRGVDTDTFRPAKKHRSERVRLVYCGRVSPEKGISEFLELDNRYEKTVIGDGISLEECKRQHPGVRFTGFLHGRELASELASHDIFVFPSRFDTFGLVVIEAMSCGLPVACHDVRGPGEIVQGARRLGSAQDDLSEAVKACLDLIEANDSRNHVLQHYTWRNATCQFLANLVPK